MALPAWLVQATGAMKFATNPASPGVPTFGDALQGIGHSMAEHYRRGQAQPQAPGAAPAPAPSLMPQGMDLMSMRQPTPVDQIDPRLFQTVYQPKFTNFGASTGGGSLAAILQGLAGRQ
jgi:hypothetical protein